MLTPYDTRLPPELRDLKQQIEGYARDYGLDFYDTIFEVVDADDLNEIASYGGFPTRYPHWSFGMAYEELRKSYDYGLSKIYEMVINNDPCYAYLMRCNHVVDQKLVMAHVYGHSDFFKTNSYFSHTNRKMMDEMANHGARMRHYVEKHGEDEVEAFVDRCMSIDDLIDIHSTAIRRRDEVSRYDFSPEKEDDDGKATRFKSKDYMDPYINPAKALREEEEEKRKLKEQQARNFPEEPEKDVLLFLIRYAPLKPWQRDILEIIRDEAYYFSPQGQTKILNEGWACLTPDSYVYTDRGLLKIQEIVDSRSSVQVADGQVPRSVYDWARFEDRETVRVRTRRGLELEGSLSHRVLLPDGGWKPLGDVCVGERVALSGGANLWPNTFVPIAWQSQRRLSLNDIAEQTGVSLAMLRAYRYKRSKPKNEQVVCLLEEYDVGLKTLSHMQNRRQAIRVPEFLDERLAAFLGYLVGDGHMSEVKRTMGLTTGDDEQAERFMELVEDLFSVKPRKVWDDGRWRVKFSSKDLGELLKHLGIKTGFAAAIKEVPEAILRSPKSVVAAFLRAYFDADGYAGPSGVILSTSSIALGKTVQLLLLNFGILTSRKLQEDGCWHVQAQGKSAAVFYRDIGFGLRRKQEALRRYVEERCWFLEQKWDDEIVAVERRRSDVYDISVEETHRYAAQGFINHNSYWHSKIMTTKAVSASEVIDYADHHCGTLAMHGPRINPYKLGIELFRDIEQRWNTGRFGKEYDECDDLEKRRNWDKQLGLGREKIFEVRRIHNDITFIDTFLTPEFCVENKMFTYAFQEQAGIYYIDSRDFEKIKQRLLFGLTNFGKPWIYVVDGNYRNRGELLLVHQFNGVELRLDHAADTLANIQYLWGRPVHLQTLVDGKPTMLSFDGTDHAIKTGGEIDDPRRIAPAKTR